MIEIIGVVLIVIAVGTLGLLLLAWTPTVVVGNRVMRVHPWRFDSIALDDLVQINFHYDPGGVIGFEFISMSGRTMLAEANAVDYRLLASLSKRLRGFTEQSFNERFSDVPSDSFVVWKNV